ncbi:DUF4097 domain-containing protein [Alkalihalobacillus oceani]|uniref:DUF4097 domain-containing protein n=1 Tax=Halalkalibacter oceani TaxID=1653776 RepID=UPI00203D171F|nr:DUF4097 domain-containing protein [Halalkalibacter oceani]MCM3762638.1 DUF4097 domain-containing protein [Halalkalibacter oceani]
MKKLAGFALIITGIVILIASLPAVIPSTSKAVGDQGQFDLKQVDDLTFTSTAVDWEIETYSGTELLVRLENQNKRVQLQSVEQRSRLEVKIEEERFHFLSFSFTREPTKAIVQIPESYQDRVNIKTVSGDLNMSGEQDLTGLDIRTVSGDVEAGPVTAPDVKVATTSGDIEIHGLDGAAITLNSTSGDIEVSGLHGAINAKTVSGDIMVDYVAGNQAADLKTTSGDVEVWLPDGNAEIEAKTTSGDIQVNAELLDSSLQSKAISGKIGKGEHPFFISTTSGDIDLH